MFNFLKKSKNKIISFLSAIGLSFSFMVSTAFATDVNDVILKADQLKPLLDGVKGNISVLLPVGIAILAAFMGPTLVPWLVKKFKQ